MLMRYVYIKAIRIMLHFTTEWVLNIYTAPALQKCTALHHNLSHSVNSALIQEVVATILQTACHVCLCERIKGTTVMH